MYNYEHFEDLLFLVHDGDVNQIMQGNFLQHINETCKSFNVPPKKNGFTVLKFEFTVGSWLRL